MCVYIPRKVLIHRDRISTVRFKMK
ncbi:unnamed protein product [Cuscuta epithymum]|uniref:Uncharacterized protein n=1 Tax=Cuscuta epithymum TaxID=186058 RepID=A0AAV0ET98_9ASTE|nr:unnamed protein product [Cuscuta epithymum]